MDYGPTAARPRAGLYMEYRPAKARGNKIVPPDISDVFYASQVIRASTMRHRAALRITRRSFEHSQMTKSQSNHIF
jgi:hypothetical protein